MTARTYIGTRLHPKAGVVLKVGVSTAPERRARELGIEIHALLPLRCEAEIHGLLQRKRVWRGAPDLTFGVGGRLEPVFPAHTEWFYIDPALGDWLRSYIRFARETEALLAA